VSEIEETGSTSSIDSPRAARADDIGRLLVDRPPVEREGLPRGYRMRADSHYVDQLEARQSGPAIRLIPTRQIEAADAPPLAPADALAQSVARQGIVQPLLVRRRNGRYQVIAGRKRLAAAIAAGITDVPCVSYDVDDGEAAALAQADNLRFADSSGTLADAAWVSQVLRELSSDLGRLVASTALLGPTPSRSFQHRFAADFVQAQAWRASWLANAASAIVSRPKTGRFLSMATIVDRVRVGFEAESRLTGLQLDCAVSASAAAITFDEEVGTVAIASAVFATLAWMDGVDTPRVEIRVDAPNPRTVKIEVVQRSSALPADAGRYLREPAAPPTSDFTVALALLSAKSVTALYAGSVELSPIAGTGSLIQSTFSKSAAN